MPQGGIDPARTRARPRMRELYEETGVTSVDYLGETPDWMTYEFPPYDGPPHRLGDVSRPAAEVVRLSLHRRRERDRWSRDWRNGQEPEFDAWRWERLDAWRRLVVPFRRESLSRLWRGSLQV